MTKKITEEQLYNILRSTVFSAEQLMAATLLDMVNSELTIEEFREEILYKPSLKNNLKKL